MLLLAVIVSPLPDTMSAAPDVSEIVMLLLLAAIVFPLPVIEFPDADTLIVSPLATRLVAPAAFITFRLPLTVRFATQDASIVLLLPTTVKLVTMPVLISALLILSIFELPITLTDASTAVMFRVSALPNTATPQAWAIFCVTPELAIEILCCAVPSTEIKF